MTARTALPEGKGENGHKEDNGYKLFPNTKHQPGGKESSLCNEHLRTLELCNEEDSSSESWVGQL